MSENTIAEEKIRITSWDTYKILNRIKENVQQKRRIAREMYLLELAPHNFRKTEVIYFLNASIVCVFCSQIGSAIKASMRKVIRSASKIAWPHPPTN